MDEQPKVKVPLLSVYLDEATGKVEIKAKIGNNTNKKLCLNALAETIKAVANFEPSPIIPAGPSDRMHFAS